MFTFDALAMFFATSVLLSPAVWIETTIPGMAFSTLQESCRYFMRNVAAVLDRTPRSFRLSAVCAI